VPTRPLRYSVLRPQSRTSEGCSVTDRRSTGDARIDGRLGELAEQLSGGENQRLELELLAAAAGLVGDHPSRLDLKIAGAALHEMRDAFAMFAPYSGLPKVTVFGSARTQPEDPAYKAAFDVAANMASHGWMVITGAGPGIMIAANEGAGREMSFGVNIRLPFETEAHALLEGDEKLIEMKYFFTRKLMFMKEASGFIALPGGFGTQDETFELLTLQQTGKADPSPIVLLDVPGGTYWTRWHEYVTDELYGAKMIGEFDRDMYLVTDSADEACAEILNYWRNYHSIRYVGDRLVVRMKAEVDDAVLGVINERCSNLVGSGGIVRSKALQPEVDTDDVVDLPRLSFRYGNRHYGKLRPLIELINSAVD